MSQDSECVCDTCASENNYDTPEARAYWTRKRVFLAWAEALRSGNYQVQYRAHIAVDEQDALIHMNDTQGYSFDQIAEVLEVAANQGISIHAALGLIEGAASDA